MLVFRLLSKQTTTLVNRTGHCQLMVLKLEVVTDRLQLITSVHVLKDVKMLKLVTMTKRLMPQVLVPMLIST